MTIEPEDLKWLNETSHHYDTWKRVGLVLNLDGATRNKMCAIYRKYWDTGYICDINCKQCVANTITWLYSQFYKYKLENGIN